MRSPTTIFPRRAHAGTHALALGLATVLLATGCRFGVNRQLEPGDIRGTLVFETAAGEKLPAADARIVIENSAFATKTDTRGRFVFRKVPVGDYRLQIAYTAGGADNALRLGPVTVKPRDARDLGTLNVTRLGQLRGTIVRGPGNPIRAEIALPGFEPQTTGVDGRFDFARVASGAPWPVLVVAQRGNTLAYYDLPPVDVTPGAPTEKEFDLDTLDPLSESDVSTLVRLSGRDDHSGARVRFAGPDGPIDLPATNVDGRLAARLPPGVYTVRVEHDDFLPLVMEFVVVAGETDLPTILLAPDACADTPDAAGCEEVDAVQDTDADGHDDVVDNCPSTANEDQRDTDTNGIGDACTPVPTDLEAPEAPTFDGTGGLTREASVTLTGSVRPDVVSVQVFDNDNCTGGTPATTVPQSGIFSSEFSLEEGVETEFSARALDAAGNVSPCSDSQHWTSDTKPPLAPTVVSVSPGSPSNAAAVQVQVQAEPNAFVVGFQEAGCQGSLQPQPQGNADLTGTITLTFAPVSNVEAFFTFTARDEAGNQGPCGPASPDPYLSDRDPPDISNATLTLTGSMLEQGGLKWFGGNTDPAPTWSGIVGATRYEYFWAASTRCDSAVSGPLLSTTDTNAIGAPVPLEVSLAPAYFCLRAQDALGNTTDWLTTGPAQQDREGPSLETPFVSPPPTNPANVTLRAAEDLGVGLRAQPYEVYLCSDPGCTTGPVVEAAADGPTVSVPLQPCVETRIGVRAYDRVGNASNPTFTTVTVPTAPPSALGVSQRFGVVELAWTAPTGPAMRYELCAETSGNTCNSGWTDLGPATSTRLYEPYASKGRFGVRAVATSVSGCTSDPVWGTGRPSDLDGTLSASGSTSDRIGTALLVIQDPLGTGARLLVGKPGNVFRRGEVRVFRLRPTDGSFSDDGVFLQGDSNGDEFGSALASVGDVDGDGIEDFAVGAPGANDGVAANTGYVKVFAGRDLGVITKIQVASVPAALRSGTRFGATLAGGAHLVGDARPDLLIGAPAADPSGATDAGVVHIFHTDGVTWTRENAALAGVAAGQAYGSSLAMIGDIDGDGLSEFFSGSPFIDPGPSAGQAYGGGAITRAGDPWTKYFPASGPAGVDDFEAYGQWAVPVGDFDGRGKPDYAVGAPEADGGRGKVYVVMGEDLVLDGGQCASCNPNTMVGCVADCFAANQIHLTLEGDTAGGRFGLSGACIGDLDGDGRCELAVASQAGAAVSIHSYDGTQWNLLKRYPGLATSTVGVTVVAGGDPTGSGVAGFAYGAPRSELVPGDLNGIARWFMAPRDAPPLPARPPGAPLAPAFDPMTATSQGAPNWVLAGSVIGVSSVLRPSSLSPQGVLTNGGAPFAGSTFSVSPLAALGPYVPYTLPLAAGLTGTPFSWDMPLYVKAGSATVETGLGQPTVVVPVGDWTGDGFEEVAMGYPSASIDTGSEGAVRVIDGVTGALVKSFRGNSNGAGLGTSIAKAADGLGNACLIASAPRVAWGDLRLFCSNATSDITPTKVWKDNTSGPPNLGEALVYPGVDLNGTGTPDFVAYSNSNPGLLMFFDRDGTQAPWSTAVGLGGSFEQVGRQLHVVIDGTQALLVVAAVEPALPSGRSGVLLAVNARTGLGQVWRYPPVGPGVAGDDFGARLVKVPDVNGDGVRDLVATSTDSATGNKRLHVISGRGGTLVRTIAAPVGTTNWGRALSSEAGAVTAAGKVELLVSSAGYTPSSSGLVWVVDLVSGAVVRASGAIDSRTLTLGVALTLLPDRDLDQRMEPVVASVASTDGVTNNGALLEVIPSTPPPKPTQRPSDVTMSARPNQAVQLTWTAGRPTAPFTFTHVEYRQPGRAPQVLVGTGGTMSSAQLDNLEPGATYFIRIRDYTGGVDPTVWSVTHKYVVPTN